MIETESACIRMAAEMIVRTSRKHFSKGKRNPGRDGRIASLRMNILLLKITTNEEEEEGDFVKSFTYTYIKLSTSSRANSRS